MQKEDLEDRLFGSIREYGKLGIHGKEVKKMKKINKTEAKALYNKGRVIYLVPGNANLRSPWVHPISISKKRGGSFDKNVNSFEYYNCHAPFRKYAWYYIK